MATPKVLVEAEGLSRKHGQELILDRISLQIRAGEVTTIVGPSGCGKTTLLSLLGLLLQPSSGRLRVAGQEVAALSDGRRSQLRNQFFGFIFQSAQLVGSLSVLDNVLLPALLAGKAAQHRKAALGLIERLGLAARVDFLPHQLSLGQKRRAAIARALLLHPPVLLADEPTNDLDPMRAAQIEEFLLSLPSDGYALVLVTHDRALAQRAGNCWEMQAGQLGPCDLHLPRSRRATTTTHSETS